MIESNAPNFFDTYDAIIILKPTKRLRYTQKQSKTTTDQTATSKATKTRIRSAAVGIRPNPVGQESRSALKLILYLEALQPLSSWLSSLPARIGHDAAADNAALAFVSALDFYFSERTAQKAAAAASRSYMTAVKGLRSVIESPGKLSTEDTIVCVALLTFYPLLMYWPSDTRRKDVFAHQAGLKAVFSAVCGTAPPSDIALQIIYSLVETLSVDPVVHDASLTFDDDDGLWPSIQDSGTQKWVREDTFSLKQITYRLRVRTSKLNSYLIRLRTGRTSPKHLAGAIMLCREVSMLKSDELESKVLHRVRVIKNSDSVTRLLSLVSLEFVDTDDLCTCLHYWSNRLKGINLCLKMREVVGAHDRLEVDREKMYDDKRRIFRNLMMSWEHAARLGPFATIGLARGLMQVWLDVRNDTLLPEGVPKPVEAWLLEKVNHPFHTWFPTSGAESQIDEAADMLVGGQVPDWFLAD